MLTVYKASAGSGKTYTLTFEYIKMVLGYKDSSTGAYRLNINPQDEHHKILAITFTNKATDEMKRRIIKELAILAELPSVGKAKSPYLGDLIALFGCTQEQLKTTAQKVLYQLLFDYTFFNVSTIDAFFQTVLRTFAFEVELDGNYEVELNDAYAISVGMNEVFNTICYGNNERSKLLAKWIKRYMLQKINEGKSFNVLNRRSQMYSDLLSFVSKMCDERFKQHSDALLKYLDDPSRIIKFEEELSTLIAKISNNITQTAKDAYAAIKPHKGGANRYLWSALEDKWTKGDLSEPSATVVKIANGESAFTKTYLKKNPVPASLEQHISYLLSNIVTSYGQLEFLILLSKNIYGLGLIGDTMKFVNEFRENNNLILLSDTNDLLRRVISESDAPFIYERLGVRLQHFLIDEFQDTSKLQWQNLSPLVTESLSTDNDNLIIGDVKQCIYRFRNSDPSLLGEQVVVEYDGLAKERGKKITENTNWRSSAEVIRFNNTLFSALAEELNLAEYNGVTQQVASKHEDFHGYVKFVRIGDKDDNTEERKEKSLKLMATDIKRQFDSGYTPGDIAILVRDGKDGQMVIDYLLRIMADPDSDFPTCDIISDDTLQIGTSPMVKLIVSVLRLLNNDIEPIDSRHISQRQFHKIVNRYEYHLNHGKVPNDALALALNEEHPEIDKLVDEVADMEYTSLPSLVERIIEIFVPHDLRERDKAFIIAFQDEVLDFCAYGSCDINSFLKWWDNPKVKHNVTSSSDIDAIRVMTIHKSKGLEFKCVHIPIADWPLTQDKDFAWFGQPQISGIDPDLIPPIFALKSNKSLENTLYADEYYRLHKEEIVDTINVTYVAFTRAVVELCVNCVIPMKGESSCIGTTIFNAFEKADSEFCERKTKEYTDVKGTLFVPLTAIDGLLEIGKPTTATAEEKKEEIPAEQLSTRDAADYITKYDDEIWKLTRVDDLVPMAEAQERGVFLHNVMSSVRRVKDLPLAVKRWGYRARLSEEEKANVYDYLHKAISDDRVAQWFHGFKRVVTERPIALKGKDTKPRPDRIVWTVNGTIDVVDYKFGKEEKEDYNEQVKRYMKHLTDAGYQQVRGFLWYVDENKIEPV